MTHAQPDTSPDTVEITANVKTAADPHNLSQIAHAEINPKANEDIPPSARELATFSEELDNLEHIAAAVGIKIEESAAQAT